MRTPTRDTCYLLAWIVEKDGVLIVDGAGVYSEPPGTITHSLNKTSPVIVETTEGESYHEARTEMDALIKHYLGMNIPSVRRKIFEMVLQDRG